MMNSKPQLFLEFGRAVDSLHLSANVLEHILMTAICSELGSNEKIYDQRRYDIVFEGVHRVFGLTRVQFHQRILETNSLFKSTPDLLKSFREILPENARIILVQIVNEVILEGCTDAEFKVYFTQKSALKFGARTD